jgi:hypothetical protein
MQTAGDKRDHLARLIASSYEEAVGSLPFLKPMDNSDWSAFRPIAARLTQDPEEGPATLLKWLTERGCLTSAAPQQTIMAHLQRTARHLQLLKTSPAMPVVQGTLFVWQASQGIGAGTDVWRRRHDMPVYCKRIEADHATLMNLPAVQEIAHQVNLAYEQESL